jgi:glycosyltransferase involved in cell wall biosynthesis
MKVLLSAFQCSPDRGSEPGNGWHWATALAQYGHEVTVLTCSDFREPILAAGTSGIEFCFIDLPGSRLYRMSPRWGQYGVYRRWQAEAFAQAADRAGQYDVAHHVTWASLRLGSMLWQLPVPLVYGPIGGGQAAPRRYWRYFGRNWPAEALRNVSGGPLLRLNSRSRGTIRNAAVTLVVNSATAAAAVRLGGSDVRYMLADALPEDSIAPARQRPAGTPVVLWAGRLESHKAPGLAVEAFAELRRTTPARLVIAGDGPLRDDVRALAERLGVAADVDLLGQVPFAELRRLYDEASVFLFTWLGGNQGGADVQPSRVAGSPGRRPARRPGRPGLGVAQRSGRRLGIGAGLAVQGRGSDQDLPGDRANPVPGVLRRPAAAALAGRVVPALTRCPLPVSGGRPAALMVSGRRCPPGWLSRSVRSAQCQRPASGTAARRPARHCGRLRLCLAVCRMPGWCPASHLRARVGPKEAHHASLCHQPGPVSRAAVARDRATDARRA